MGLSWAYYFAALLTLGSALICLALPKPQGEEAKMEEHYDAQTALR